MQSAIRLSQVTTGFPLQSLVPGGKEGAVLSAQLSPSQDGTERAEVLLVWWRLRGPKWHRGGASEVADSLPNCTRVAHKRDVLHQEVPALLPAQRPLGLLVPYFRAGSVTSISDFPSLKDIGLTVECPLSAT